MRLRGDARYVYRYPVGGEDVISYCAVDASRITLGYVGKGDRARKVTIGDTVNLIREVCREGIEWMESEIFPLHVPARVHNLDIEDMRVKARFDREELQRELAKLREDRQAWLDQFKALRPRIQAAAY